MILETKRLYLREMNATDFEDLCGMLCDQEVMYAYEHAFSLEEAQKWLQRQIQCYHDDGVGLWAVIQKTDGAMVGQCGITKQKLPHKEVWEVGYLLKKEYWGKGYATEASNGCIQYAFQELKLTHIYSIIRDNNIASQRVAIANQMEKVGDFVKYYYHLHMPHDIYCIENNALVKHVYIDAEFDAVKFNGRYHQMVISLGAVCCDKNGTVFDKFYDTVRPKYYQRTSKVVLKMTGLEEELIRSSRSLQEVLNDFYAWRNAIDKEVEHFQYYSFGPDDKRTLLQHCKIEHIEMDSTFTTVHDLQKPLSASVRYKDVLVSPTLSLDHLKLVYGIQGEVEHNALTDAIDLMHVHRAYLQHKPCREEQIDAIVKQKEETLLKSKIKQQKRLERIMKRRFSFVKDRIKIRFLPEVLDQFRSWEAHDTYFSLHFKKDSVVYEKDVYAYDQLTMYMQLHVDVEVPYVTLEFTYEQISYEKRFLLSYRNASGIENIFKRMEAYHE